MCYYVSAKMSRAEIFQLEQDFAAHWEDEDFQPYYVVSGFAHPKLPVITAEKRFKLYRWGLIPAWVKDWQSAVKLRTQTLNAIGETIDSKPSFRAAVNSGRFCVVPVNGFYEWHHHSNDQKYPHFIYSKNRTMFFLAGLYERWINRALEEVHDTFTIITTPANQRMEWIHNSKKRMPAILTYQSAKSWLDEGLPYSEKKKLLAPYDDELMADHTIGKLITSRKENSNTAAVMEPFVYPELNTGK